MTLISVIGIEGSTALVERLAGRGNAAVAAFYEDRSKNPFPTDGRMYALHAQCTTLLLQDHCFREALRFAGSIEEEGSRRKRVRPDPSEPLTRPVAFCDFHPFLSLIQAEFLLSSHEQRELIRTLYRLLRIPDPDIVVYLRADVDVITARLRERSVDASSVDVQMIARASEAFSAFFRKYRGEKVELDTSSLDYINDPQALAAILREVPLLYMRSEQEPSPAKGSPELSG